ncbi:AAA family ATPase [Bradyrhizobium sp. WSM1417]|uniref:AAA family ATPase n=1 Tax=Bradyrhizobium sp. WSM1417 TaxID=754500 RepID=UPI00048867C6|nr:AAA family ATPase [Bradyrhizobium sp. WSM1417]
MGDPARAAAAILRIRPKGLVKLTAIDPIGSKDVMRGTKCFKLPEDRDSLRRWIAARDGKENLYLEPNPPRAHADKRSKESDIAAVEYAYVDCDPKNGEDPAAAQERLRERLASGDVPEPTFVYSSGGGVVALWRHAKPITDLEQARAINIGLARALGGQTEGFDSCQSIDHLYRAPHTTNIPNEKKRAKGRKTTVAGGLEGDAARRYTPDELPKGQVAEVHDAPGLGDVPDVALDDLPISDTLKEIIRDGRSENCDAPDDDSNSGWRMKAINLMAAAGITQEQIVGLFDERANGDLVDALHEKHGSRAAVRKRIRDEYAKAQAYIAEGRKDDFADDLDLLDDDDAKTVVRLKPKKTTKANPYAGVSLAAILATKPPKWTLEGIIPKGSFFEIFGREKAGKTFWALHLALCVATDNDCFGRAVAPGRVLYIIAEGNRRLFANRVLAWIKGQAGNNAERAAELRAAIDQNFRMVPIPVYMNREKDAKALVEANPGRWSMMVIDTLFRNMEGDPNGSQDMSRFVKGIDFVRTRLRATMLLLHHPGHSNTERSQGSSALAAAIDGRVRFFIGKDKKTRVWQVMFLRDGKVPEKPDAFELVPAVVEVGGVTYDWDDPNDDSEVTLPDVVSPYLSKIEVPSAAKDFGGELTDEEELLIRIVTETPATQKALENGKWKRSRLSRTVALCVMNSWLEKGTLKPTKQGLKHAETLDVDDAEEGFG